MHNPRGSNNRNREESTNADNQQRLFNSQNNAKGGYCWGPPMKFYEGSLLQVEWTSQHGCGQGHPNVDCDVILQYMCHPTVRDGVVTGKITEDNYEEKTTDPKTGENVFKYGMHESLEFYQSCAKRQRNRGLFAADQNIPNNAKATRTRQKNNDQQHGFECQEERDYYPYWHPTPWRDIAVLTSNPGRCKYFKGHSQNVEGRFSCSVPEFNNQTSCESNSGEWVYTRAWNVGSPECVPNAFARDNHNGNIKTGYTNSFNFIMPSLDSIQDQNPDGTANCVLRIRYNISTEDYYGYAPVDFGGAMIDSSFNGAKSPVRNDPYVYFGNDTNGYGWPLRLALNTAQTGRTFQDRSHMFNIIRRPANIPPSQRIYNLNVRGKRGNIVQVYPAVEYDFVPNSLSINSGDLVHFQWTGCDTNPAGNDGEGTAKTDRSNIVQIKNQRANYPSQYDEQNMFSASKAFEMAHLNQYDGKICKTDTETGCCKTLEQLGNNNDQNVQNCAKLNDPNAAYFDGGLVGLSTGFYSYISTRNNNFSNRSQKGSIEVKPLLPAWGIVLSAFGAIGFITAAVLAAAVYFAQTHPTSAIAGVLAGHKI